MNKQANFSRHHGLIFPTELFIFWHDSNILLNKIISSIAAVILIRHEEIIMPGKEIRSDNNESISTPGFYLGGANETMISRKT